MHELAGRLKALDPEASASLQIITYFDALVANGAGVEALLRAAATLTGVVVGARLPRGQVRIDATGKRRSGDPEGQEPEFDPLFVREISVSPSARVWIERRDSPHASDAMILDRLSLSIAAVHGRRDLPDLDAIEVLLDNRSSREERAVAAARLRLDAGSPVRIAALPVDAGEYVPGHSTITAGTRGMVRVVLCSPGTVPRSGPAGHALASTPDRLPLAWSDAQFGLRLSDSIRPVVDTDELGVMMALVRAFDPDEPLHPDVAVLRDLDGSTRNRLDELVAATSIRQAAASLGIHHSTLQARRDALVQRLGYDPRSPTGRPRYEAARLWSRLL